MFQTLLIPPLVRKWTVMGQREATVEVVHLLYKAPAEHPRESLWDEPRVDGECVDSSRTLAHYEYQNAKSTVNNG